MHVRNGRLLNCHVVEPFIHISDPPTPAQQQPTTISPLRPVTMSVVATITSAVAAISATSTINPEASIVAAIAASSTFDLNDLPSAFLSAAADASSSGPDPRLYWALIIILPVGFVLILSIAVSATTQLRCHSRDED